MQDGVSFGVHLLRAWLFQSYQLFCCGSQLFIHNTANDLKAAENSHVAHQLGGRLYLLALLFHGSRGDQMSRELVLTASASLLVGILSAQLPELPHQIETRQEIAPTLSKHRTEHQALFAQLDSTADRRRERKKTNFSLYFFKLLWWRKTSFK